MNAGRYLISLGALLVVLGLVVTLLGRLHLPLGRLPGDVVWKGRNTTVYFPWVTCIVLSVLGSLLWWLLSRR